jgi:hypothetical protein
MWPECGIPMRVLACRRPIAALAGAILALAAGLIAPSTAQASCGNYVMLKGSSHGANDNGSMLNRTPLAPTDHKAPCSGPECRQGSQAPPLVPPAPPPTGVDKEGCSVALVLLAEFDPTFHWLSDSSSHPIRRVVTIYHPPR